MSSKKTPLVLTDKTGTIKKKLSNIKSAIEKKLDIRRKELVKNSYNNAAAGLVHNPNNYDDEEEFPPEILTAEECTFETYNELGFYVSTIEDVEIKKFIDELHILLTTSFIIGKNPKSETVFNTYSVEDADILRKKRYSKVDGGRKQLVMKNLDQRKGPDKRIRVLINLIGDYIQKKILREINVIVSDTEVEGMVYSLLETAAPIKVRKRGKDGKFVDSYDQVCIIDIYYFISETYSLQEIIHRYLIRSFIQMFKLIVITKQFTHISLSGF